MTLSVSEMVEAQTILSDPDPDKTSKDKTRAFYAYLDSKGEGYGRLGLGVTNNDTWQGQVANGFSDSGSEDNNVDISYDSSSWENLNAALAQKHLDAYVFNGAAEPRWDQVQQYHNEEYRVANLDQDDWFPNRLLDNSADPEALWADWQENTGSADIFEDAIDIFKASGGNDIALAGFALSLGNFLLGAQSLQNFTAEEAEFLQNFANALSNLDEVGVKDLLTDLFGEETGGQLADNFADFVYEGLIDTAPVPLPAAWLIDKVLPKYEAAESPPYSPLVLDLDGDGIELAAVNGPGSVYWDINLDGMAEASGWIAGGDGLLAIDTNGDGVVTDHTELFGNGTGAANGFLALAAYDSNNDSYITSADIQFDALLVWVDANADGYSQEEELHTLDDLAITSINLGYTDVSYKLNGNDILQESTFTINGQTHEIVDAWFSYDRTNTVFADDYTLDIRTLFLPTLRGYGQMPDLHISMSLDNGTDGLLEMVQEIAAADIATLFDPSFGLEDKILDVMYSWAGVQDVVEGSRGRYADAQELGFLESLVGAPYLQWGDYSNPDHRIGTIIYDAFDDAYNALQARILMQTVASDLFEESVIYNPMTDVFEGVFTLNADALAAVMATHTGSDEELLVSFIDLFLFLDNTVGIDNLSALDLQAINDTLFALNPTLDIESVMIQAYPEAQTLSGTAGDDIYRGGSGIDSLSRSDGDDVFYGRQGGDYIDGGSGDDVIIGGSGNDSLYGGAGNDVFVFGLNSGTDTITEYIDYGIDEIRFVDGISPDDIRTWVDNPNSGSLHIKNIFTGDEVIVDGFTSGGGPTTVTERVEKIVFEGNVVDQTDDIIWDISQGLFLNDTDDTHLVAGSDLDDVIFGNGGNDNLYGLGGEDYLSGGHGNDIIFGGTGEDTAIFSGAYADYTIINTINASTVTDNVRSDGADTLFGVETFKFSDGTLDVASETFKPSDVTPTNNLPSANNDSFTIDEDTVLSDNVLSNDNDPDDDALNVSLLSNVSNGALQSSA